MTLFDKIFAAFKPASKEAVEAVAEAVAAPAAVVAEADPVALADMANRLVASVYDLEVADSLSPVFVAMSAVEGFDKVMELLDAKEKQIAAIGANTPLQSNPSAKAEPVVTKTPTATEILAARNK